MSRRVGIFVDTTNLFYQVGKKYSGRRLDYYKYLTSLHNMEGCVVNKAIAYGEMPNATAEYFIKCLQRYGFITQFEGYKINNWSVAITIDVMKLIDRLDVVVLGTSDVTILPLLDWIGHQRVDSMVFGCNVPDLLKNTCNSSIEIEENYLEDPA